MKFQRLSRWTAAALSAVLCIGCIMPQSRVSADSEIAHDPSRDVNAEGVGNPFGYGERNTPENASTEEIRAINHAMSVQEVKYALYKEIDEHWDLLTVRLGQTDREKVYALFLGVGTRESTLGGNGDGADLETAYSQGFGVSSAHAYGTLQTAVTAFADCDPTFMKEEDVPEMYQYSLSESTFYDAIISNHMGIRKILHFVHSAMVDYNLTGYQVVRAALKGHNTGWADFDENNVGYYANYPDEIIAQAKWYYEEGHLYDNVFSWTGNQAIESYRNSEPWEWWGDGQPSLAEITAQPQQTTTTSTTATTSTTETTLSIEQNTLMGDVDLNGAVSIADAVLLVKFLCGTEQFVSKQSRAADMDYNGKLTVADLTMLKRYLIAQGR
ncbi:MAG: dockerin type I repeat-containing protein [Oscillospiraceae bacterium]|nr:dockerin type I repeat-containing protein [Oscillospiraceae bacterium]